MGYFIGKFIILLLLILLAGMGIKLANVKNKPAIPTKEEQSEDEWNEF